MKFKSWTCCYVLSANRTLFSVFILGFCPFITAETGAAISGMLTKMLKIRALRYSHFKLKGLFHENLLNQRTCDKLGKFKSSELTLFLKKRSSLHCISKRRAKHYSCNTRKKGIGSKN